MREDQGRFAGREGQIVYRVWTPPAPRRVLLVAHGYAEHSGRYAHVAEALGTDGAVVFAPDHLGHGRSAGERAWVRSFDSVVADYETLAGLARAAHPGLPVVSIGHSMGGLVATLHAARHGDALAGLVLSGPAIGNPRLAQDLLDLDEIPDQPLDESTLSRDPAVGRAYAADPLVYRGPFKRETLEALVAGIAEAAAAADRILLPVLYLHGAADELVPPAPARAAVEAFASDDVSVRLYEGARHEPFNETNRDEVLADMRAFVRRAAP